jgi:hypothetical protein
VGLVAATGALSACNGGDQAKQSSATHHTAAASATPSASSGGAGSSAATSSSGHLDKAGLVRALTVGQARAGSAHVSVSMTGASSLRAHGDVSYRGRQPQMRLTMTMAQLGSRTMQFRYVDRVVYLRIPHVTPAGKFLRIDPRDKANPMARSFGSLSGQLDPLGGFGAMKAGMRTVRFVGHTTIDGTPTDHYVVTVDTAAVAKAMKQPTSSAMPAHVTYDMWLSTRNLLRRMRVDLQGLTTQMDLTRWGEHVHVAAPPESQVVDPSRLSG